MNSETLRYYERRGLLAEPPRTSGGYRDYPASTVDLLVFVKRAQELGFTLQRWMSSCTWMSAARTAVTRLAAWPSSAVPTSAGGWRISSGCATR